MAKLYDNNLKTPYQPQSVEEDKWIEYIIVDAKKKGIIKWFYLENWADSFLFLGPSE